MVNLILNSSSSGGNSSRSSSINSSGGKSSTVVLAEIRIAIYMYANLHGRWRRRQSGGLKQVPVLETNL